MARNANTDRVRASRDGDQFHYLWAARRCLYLLDSRSGLVAVSIEGASRSEASSGDHLEAGEELIDVAEYYGSEDISQADRIEYIQLKHSTYQASKAWTPSGVEKTLSGFSKRYRELLRHFDKVYLQGKVTFRFVSNRPIQLKLLEAITDAANASTSRHAGILAKLKSFTGLDDQELSDFCHLLRLEGDEDGYWEQRNILFHDISGYLPDLDVDAPVQLKELVSRKALSESAENPAITKHDVLRALKVDDHALYPAPCLIRTEPNAVAREQEPDLTSIIIGASHRPVIIHADAGVGKSVFATRIGLALPEGSVCVLYDCFGNAEYRNASRFRHRHKDAIPQIANELAGRGLCHPLIPTPNADPSAYLRAFLHRLRQSVTRLTAKHPNAIVCIVVDAADNAQMAAEEIGDRRSFIRDLLRERLPEGARLVALCRPDRQDKLDAPQNALSLGLLPFSRAETAALLRTSYPDATDHDVAEFHRLSSSNPRVQTLAISWGGPLAEVLRKLGPNPTTVADTIGTLLEQAIANLRDAVGSIEARQIERICVGLATLRPLVPIPVLASMSRVPETAIRSFALDLGRPLIVTDETIQFFDEPAETWFRDRFKPTLTDLPAFIGRLTPLASDSPYVASVLPQLMLEAEQYAELVALALSSEGLPESSPLERRDVELQRLQFALKASLRSKRYLDAAKLAMKAAGETAGDDRQRTLLQENTDLAAVFLEPNGIQEVVSRRMFGSGWIGSHHAYEAGLLSGNADLTGDSRSRLRMAYQWLQNWSRLPNKERQTEEVSVKDIAEIAMAELNVHGGDHAAQCTRGWRPRSISFQSGTILAKRLVDHGRYRDLEKLSLAAGNDLYLLLAITREMRVVHRQPPSKVIARALRLFLDRRVKLDDLRPWDHDETILHAVVTLVEAAIKLGFQDTADLVSALDKQLPEKPPPNLASRYGTGTFVLVRAYTLRAALANQPIELADIAHSELKKKLKKDPKGSFTQEAREFTEDIGSLLPWHRLWAEVALGRVSAETLLNAVEFTRNEADKSQNTWHGNTSHVSNEIAKLWLDILITTGLTSPEAVGALGQWESSLKRPLFTTTLTHLARLTARTAGLEEQALEYASRAFQRIQDDRDHADAKAEASVELSRAILTLSRDEAEGYFNAAVEVASKIGDEVIDRWGAMLDLADRAANPKVRHPEIAYRFARCGELIYDYMARDKHFDWEATVRAITGLCPPSVIAILSRWRDRDFGWPARILPTAIQSLIENNAIHPKTALGLLPLRADWDLSVCLGSALATCSTMSEKQVILDLFVRYTILEERSSKSWHSIKCVCTSQGLEIPGIDEFIRIADRREQSRRSTDSIQLSKSPKKSPDETLRDWDAFFDGVDLTASSKVARSYDRFRSSDPPNYDEEFFREICLRIPTGQEARFIDAMRSVTSFNLYQYRSFLEQYPESWKSRVSTKPALARLVRDVLSRFCMEITSSRYYQTFPIGLASEASGITETELVEMALSAISGATEIVGANRLFTLVGLLAARLNEAEAREALAFSLELLEDFLEESDGDGLWSESLAPPGHIDEAIAGYLWAALAAPQASYRWEAAHSVRAMCALGRADVLRHLMRMFAKDSGGAFADARLHFYRLHARQWLLIALARASKESPGLIVPHYQHLSQIALGGTKHILLREFAARAVLALIDSGHFAASTEKRQQLAKVNLSPFPAFQSKFHERMHQRPTCSPDDTDDDHFLFGIDTGPYWFAPLGRCFGVSQSEIERRARDVIRMDLGFTGTGRWDDDQRARRGVFKDRDTIHSHGSYPRTDDLHFYLSYHAMMVVAGHLLATLPLHQDPEYPWDDFGDWFSRHDLTRADGKWLADRRDPTPLEWPDWKDGNSADGWRWSLAGEDFDKVLFRPDGKVTVWGCWTAMFGERQETVDITSGLVSTGRSQALLRALQTANSPHDYRIPEASGDAEIDHGDFRLNGWIVEQTDEAGFEKQDPWAGEIRFPPIRPAKFVEESMGLSSDAEQRVWTTVIEDRAVPVLWSRVWGSIRDRDDEDERESGHRCQASISWLKRLLVASETDLLVSVEMDRRQRYSRYSRRENEGLSYVPRSAKLFLIRGDGSVLTV